MDTPGFLRHHQWHCLTIWHAVLLFIFLYSGYPVRAAITPEKRVALVIGNSSYKEVSALANPVNDANSVADALKRLGFQVIFRANLDHEGMRRALRDFSDLAADSDIGLVYYAGHGIEVDKKNFLIPIDASLKTDKDIEFEAISLEFVLNSLDGNARLKLILLDACRDNPFLSKMKRSLAKRSIGRGLAAANPTDGMLISYAAVEGATAADGDNDHSPYTQSLLDNIETPGVELNLLFRKIRDDVLRMTKNEQEPFFYASLPGVPVYLKPAGDIKIENSPVSSAAQDWINIKDTNSISALRAFQKTHSDPIYAALAEDRLAMLEKIERETTTPATATILDAQELQRELVRVGCAQGGVDGKWGKESQRSAAAFAKFAKLSIATEQPNFELLEALKNSEPRVCPKTEVTPDKSKGNKKPITRKKNASSEQFSQTKRRKNAGSSCVEFNGSMICD